MVKSTGSSPKSTGLSDVVEQLRANNRLVDQQNNNIQALLNEALSSDSTSGSSETHKYGEKDAVDAAFDKLTG